MKVCSRSQTYISLVPELILLHAIVKVGYCSVRNSAKLYEIIPTSVLHQKIKRIASMVFGHRPHRDDLFNHD